MKDTTIRNQLTAFGLTDTEAQIYLHLVNKAPKSVLDIARELDLPRSSVYDGANKLSEKGLIQRIVKYKSQQLRAYPLNILQAYIDKEKTRVEELQSNLVNLESAISSTEASPLTTEVRYYHGPKGLQQMIWNTLRATNELIGYSQFGLVDVVSKRFTEKYASELIQRDIRNRVITSPKYLDAWHLNIEPLATYRRTLQQCRTIDSKKLYISGDVTIYNNVFATAYWEHSEIVGVEIENLEIAKTQRSMFDLAWEQADSVSFNTQA